MFVIKQFNLYALTNVCHKAVYKQAMDCLPNGSDAGLDNIIWRLGLLQKIDLTIPRHTDNLGEFF